MRYQAPADVSGISCFAGDFRADESGAIDTGADASDALDAVLRAAGWTPVSGAEAAKPAPPKAAEKAAADTPKAPPAPPAE